MKLRYVLVVEAAELVDEQRALGARGVRDALLDDVGGELVLRQLQHLPADGGDEARAVLGRAVLQHVLHDVVAVLVLDELVRVRVQLAEHGRGLLARAVLEDALDDAAAVRVRRQRVHLSRESIYYKLQSRRFYTLDTFLNLES